MSSSLNKVGYVKQDLPPLISKLAYGLTAVGLILVVLAYITDPTRSAFNNIILLMFLTSIGLGSLFLVALEYLAGAVWSTPFRRIAEFLAATLVILPLVAIPIYFNMHDLFHWTHLEAVEHDTILSGKSAYLNMGFFTIRAVAFFSIWILFYWLISRNSKKQDLTGEDKLTK
ncbi:MAG: quinol:cytochrome C oxidoreductase, partial [Melioribacteraceae bacterium]